MVAREPALDRHVAQLVHRYDGCGHGELRVDVVEKVGADRPGGSDGPAGQPGRVAERVIDGRDVLVQHRRAGLRRDEQPGVSGLAAGHQQQAQTDALQQQGSFRTCAARDGDGRATEHHPQCPVAERMAFGNGETHHPPHQKEDDVDTDCGTGRDHSLPPGEHHHRQRHTGVQQKSRLRGQYHLFHLIGDRPRQAVATRGDLQRDEES